MMLWKWMGWQRRLEALLGEGWLCLGLEADATVAALPCPDTRS
ncbi:MAG: hypothetical protein ACT4NV_09160 [Rhodoferax sp.]